MIPQNLQRKDVQKAIKDITESGIPETRHSTKWRLLYLTDRPNIGSKVTEEVVKIQDMIKEMI